MKHILKPKPKEPIYKCYKCGSMSDQNVKYCPQCLENGFKIKMIINMENQS